MPNEVNIQAIHYSPNRLPDVFMMELWRQIEREGKKPWVSYSDDPTTRTPATFIKTLKCGRFDFWVARFNGDPGLCVWVNDMRPNTANLHFCTLGDLGTVDKVKACKRTLHHIMMAHGLETVYGMIPASNEKALGFVNLMGWHQAGVIPNGIYSWRLQRSEDVALVFYEFEGGCDVRG